MTRYAFSIPRLPSAALSPNAKKQHWAAHRLARDTDRQDAIGYFLDKYPRPDKPLESARIKVRVYFKQRRVRDLDNWSARMVGFYNGLKGLAFKDDSFECIGQPEYEFLVDPAKGPAVEFEIEGE